MPLAIHSEGANKQNTNYNVYCGEELDDWYAPIKRTKEMEKMCQQE